MTLTFCFPPWACLSLAIHDERSVRSVTVLRFILYFLMDDFYPTQLVTGRVYATVNVSVCLSVWDAMYCDVTVRPRAKVRPTIDSL